MPTGHCFRGAGTPVERREKVRQPCRFSERVVDTGLPLGAAGAEGGEDIGIEAEGGADFRHVGFRTAPAQRGSGELCLAFGSADTGQLIV